MAAKPCPFNPPSSQESLNGGFDYNSKKDIALHHTFDPGFGDALISFINTQTLVDIGAGVGQLGYFFNKRNASIAWTGFDGGSNVQSLWGKNVYIRYDNNFIVPKVCWMDASKPVQLNKSFDWVISLEVGEHIDKQFESIFLDNLVSYCTKGIILSWATPGQNGHHHVNTRSNDYIISQMRERNIEFDEKQTKLFRKAVTKDYYLVKSLMVFRKQ